MVGCVQHSYVARCSSFPQRHLIYIYPPPPHRHPRVLPVYISLVIHLGVQHLQYLPRCYTPACKLCTRGHNSRSSVPIYSREKPEEIFRWCVKGHTSQRKRSVGVYIVIHLGLMLHSRCSRNKKRREQIQLVVVVVELMLNVLRCHLTY